MLLYSGSTPTLIVSSADMDREMLTTHDIVFSNRPRTLAANILFYGCTDLGFSPYGDYWRQVRKICVVEMLSLNRVNSFQLVQDEEVVETIESIRRTCLYGTLDMFIGGIDSVWTTLEWTMAELMRNQDILKKVQDEVRRVVGKKSKVEGNDINTMNYLKCTIKESLRLHPPTSLLVPRESSKAINLGGYDIPPKTNVIINAMAIQRDPNIWERPEEFMPERFEENPVDYRIQDFKFIAFGGGRRQCPGLRFGVTSVECILANLLSWFDWKMPEGKKGEDLDMTESNGLTVYKKVPLHLIATPYSP